MGLRTWGVVAGLAMAMAAPSALAQMQAGGIVDPSHPGKGIYDRTCAGCHANPGQTRAAAFSTITGMSPTQLRTTLTEGVMKPMAAGLSADELTSLIGYLTSGQKAPPAGWAEAMLCKPEDRAVDTSKPVAFGGFGVDLASTRSLPAAKAGLTKSDMGRLDIAWAIGFPQTQSLGVGSAVLGDTVYLTAAGKLFALDAAKGCARWIKPALSRNTPQIADLDGRKVLAFAGLRGGDIHVVDAKTGEEIWTADGRPSNGQGSVRGGVVVYRDKVIVPISASGVGAGMNPKFECCAGHGAVVALSLKDGKKLWQYDTMTESAPNGLTSSAGVKLRGPSGAPIWALPTIDVTRNRVIVATGENTSFPGTNTSDAIIAIDLDTGKQAWVFQAMSSDIWNMACNDRDLPKSGPNCPRLYKWGEAGRDFDFGATPVIVKGPKGHDLVLDGQKSGHVFGLDAATGKKLWVTRIGEGTTLGGVHWGNATDGKNLYVAVADSLFTLEEQGTRSKAGLYALDVATGKQRWAYAAKADCPPARAAVLVACQTKYGFSAAPLVIGQTVVGGTLDGKLMVFDAATGKVLKIIDTAGPIRTLNGITGQGGAIDSHAISAGDGMLFVTSGYGAFTQTPGNVLIALRPKR